MNTYYGHYSYDDPTVTGWQYALVGVYYCGYLNPQNPNLLVPCYIGKATGDNGIRGRLLDHLREDYWPLVTHFGYQLCSTAREADLLEAAEIQKYQPTYNTQLVSCQKNHYT